jgi:hypothetical protein
MERIRLQFARPMSKWLLSIAACIALIGAPPIGAQAPAASGDVAQAPSPEELEKLVGPIALYPDDLVAIILPAATNPLQIVQADRFLQKRKQDSKAPIDEKWDDSVKALVNYPDVVKQMSADLDWTADLGEAVVADQGAVLGAVQAFRRKAQSAGNLKSDDKQVVEVEKEVIKIVPADPQVIYVPQYNPSTVVVYSSAPVYGYYPAPYPAYYYPYPPGAALATGLIWGAAIGAAWHGGWGCDWNGGSINNNVTINRGDVNVNRGQGNRGQGNRPGGSGQGSAWKSDKRPGQVSSGAGRPTQTSARVGDARGGGGAGGAGGGFGGGAGAGARPSTQAGGGGMGQGARNQPGAVSTSGAATRTGGASAGSGGRDAFGGYGSGSAARADSSRGSASRSSMSSAGSRPSAGSYGGGASRGGGGGGRGGGGGGRGGRR